MSSTVIRSVSFPKDVFQEINDIAKVEKRPRSQILSDAVRRYYRVWLLEREQAVGRKYAKKLGLKSEKDATDLLGS